MQNLARSTFLVFLLSASVIAQTSPPPVVSPEVHADRKVTFRLAAPHAKDAGFYGDWMRPGTVEKMQKGADGVWSYTTATPLPASIYIYHFTVDGLTIADPVNPRMKLRARTSASMVEVPSATGTAELWEAREVPHGTVEINYQKSKVLNGETRSFWVYTPPGYEKDRSKTYPVLYLFHGSNDTAGGWVLAGQANYILDNLIADKKAVPMIVVMPFGHAVPFGSPREVQATNTEVYDRYVMQDVLPLVESKYRVKKDRANRAIAGLSMGGGQSLSIGFNHLDMFHAVGAFSAAVPEKFESRLGGLAKNKLKVLWFACGVDDFLIQRSRDLDALLTKNNVPHTFRATPGAHTYTVWRQYLGEFAPLLFRE
jgi:enterochelin esterase-like enzyme